MVNKQPHVNRDSEALLQELMTTPVVQGIPVAENGAITWDSTRALGKYTLPVSAAALHSSGRVVTFADSQHGLTSAWGAACR